MKIRGTWTNTYGSVMTLEPYSNGLVGGLYQSSTGSTGIYRVVGYTHSEAAAPQKGQSIALAISWRSIAGGRGDQSWNWVSGLSGQLSGGEDASTDNLTLMHALVATNPFPDFAPIGTYIDKLLYNRREPTAWDHPLPSPMDLQPSNETPQQTDNTPINGTWVGLEDPSIILTTTLIDNDQGLVRGSIILANRIIPLIGFTDVCAVHDSLTLQSLSLSGAIEETGCCLSLAGSLDYTSNVLTLTNFSSSPQAPSSLYLQTQVSSLTLVRQDV